MKTRIRKALVVLHDGLVAETDADEEEIGDFIDGVEAQIQEIFFTEDDNDEPESQQ